MTKADNIKKYNRRETTQIKLLNFDTESRIFNGETVQSKGAGSVPITGRINVDCIPDAKDAIGEVITTVTVKHGKTAFSYRILTTDEVQNLAD